jgi:hypothetical protein
MRCDMVLERAFHPDLMDALKKVKRTRWNDFILKHAQANIACQLSGDTDQIAPVAARKTPRPHQTRVDLHSVDTQDAGDNSNYLKDLGFTASSFSRHLDMPDVPLMSGASRERG